MVFLTRSSIKVQTDAADLSAGLQRLLRALDLEGIGDGDWRSDVGSSDLVLFLVLKNSPSTITLWVI